MVVDHDRRLRSLQRIRDFSTCAAPKSERPKSDSL